MNEQAAAVVRAYYEAFNRGDWAGMVALLTEDVAHDINQGAREIGREPFRRFLAHMERCYREQLRDIVVLTEPSGERAAAEFVVHGTYLVLQPMGICRRRKARPTCCPLWRSSRCGRDASLAFPTSTICRIGLGRSALETRYGASYLAANAKRGIPSRISRLGRVILLSGC